MRLAAEEELAEFQVDLTMLAGQRAPLWIVLERTERTPEALQPAVGRRWGIPRRTLMGAFEIRSASR